MTSGWPFESTRVEPETGIHVAFTQGPLPPGGGGKAQPATMYGPATVTVGSPLTVTRGLGTVGVACPPCAHITVAPTCTRNPGILSHHQRNLVDHHAGPQQLDGCSLAVVDVNAGIVDHDHRARRAPENDASGTRRRRSGNRRLCGKRRRVADEQQVLQRGLENNGLSRRNWRRGIRCGGHFQGAAPPTASPHWTIWITGLKLNPDSGADLRHHEHARLLACNRDGRHGPGTGNHAAYIRHRDQDAPGLQWVYIVDYRTAINAVKLRTLSHTVTVETEDPVPPRDKVKLCLYSPRLMLWLTLFT